MALEVTGKLFKVLPEVTGEGKNGTWRKQEFVLETLDSMYPKKICMEVWGDKLQILAGYSEGDIIKASIEVESREYQTKWYTNVKAWKLERDGASSSSANTASNTSNNTRSNAQIQQDPFPEDLSSNSGDSDLPF